MHKRPASTPRMGLLLAVSMFAALLTIPGHATLCREIPWMDGCADRTGSGLPYEYGTQEQSDTCIKSSVVCAGESLTLHSTYYDLGNDVGARVQWRPQTSVSQYYLQQHRKGASFCVRYSVVTDNPSHSDVLSVGITSFNYAREEPKTNIDITLFMEVGGELCIAGLTSLRVPVTCYDATRSCSRCGPDPMDRLELKVMPGETMTTGNGVVSRGVGWEWLVGWSYDNETYHVRVSGGGGEKWLEVNQMEVVLDGLNSSLTYTVSVWRYECGCVPDLPMGECTLPPVTASPMATSPLHTALLTSSPDSTPSPLPPCSSLYHRSLLSTTTTSTHTPHPSSTNPHLSSTHTSTTPHPSHTTLHPSSTHTSTTPHPSYTTLHPSSTHTSTTPHPSYTTLHPSSTHTSTTPHPSSTHTSTTPHDHPATVAVLSLITVLVVATVVMATLVAIIVYLRNRRRDHNDVEDVPPPPPPPEPWVSALVLYSQQTPEKEVEAINNRLVGGLRQYHIDVATPGRARPRELGRDWIEQGVRRAEAVLLVCNRQLDREWQGEGKGFHVGSVAKLLLESLEVSDLQKMRCVYLTESDKTYSSPSLLLRQPVCLSHKQALKDIARFVRDIPKYST